MVNGLDTGRRVVVRAADEFYEFINGQEFTLSAWHPTGMAICHKPSPEFEGVTLEFLVPPQQLEIAPNE